MAAKACPGPPCLGPLTSTGSVRCAYASARRMRSARSGRSRRRAPVAAKTAFAIAAAVGPCAASPAPTGGSLRALDHLDRHDRRLGEAGDRIAAPVDAGDALAIEGHLFEQVHYAACTMPPSIWFRSPSGSTTSPASTAPVTRSKRIAPLPRSTATSATTAT